MASAPTTPAPTQFMQPYETDILRGLLIVRQQANDNVKSYLLQLLGQRGLDPNLYGIAPDLRSFTLIAPPEAPAATPMVPDTAATTEPAPGTEEPVNS